MLERISHYEPPKERSVAMPATNSTEQAIARLLRQGFQSDRRDWSTLVQLAESGVPISGPNS